MERYIVWDTEILKAIPSDKEPRIEGIEYCSGWGDHTGMGISCICAYDYSEERMRIFCADNLSEFQKLITLPCTLVTFNGVKFDNKVAEANGITFNEDVRHYDILRELWIADKLNPDNFNFRTHGGYKLDDCVGVNFGLAKTGHGALAPVDWQQGKIGAVIDYCAMDVLLTKKLFDLILNRQEFKHPKTAYPVALPSPVSTDWMSKQS